MHFGLSDRHRTYKLNYRVLRNADEQRDLGVQIHNSVKVATQIDRMMTGYGMPAFIGWAWNIELGMFYCYFTKY